MKPLSINIKIAGIEILSKSFEERPKENYEGSFFSFDINVETRANPTDKTVIVFSQVIIRDGNKPLILGAIKAAVGFHVENFEDIVKLKDGGRYDIPPELDYLVKSASIPTVRGMIFSEFRGTYLHNAIMPLVFLDPPADPTIAKGK